MALPLVGSFFLDSFNGKCFRLTKTIKCHIMKIRYSRHALLRMSQRGISQFDVEEALVFGTKGSAPGEIRMATHRTRIVTLVVKYQIITAQEIKIVTTYFQ